jgi:hypothetical protein
MRISLRCALRDSNPRPSPCKGVLSRSSPYRSVRVRRVPAGYRWCTVPGVLTHSAFPDDDWQQSWQQQVTRGNGHWVQGGLSEILEVDRVCSEGRVTTRRPRTNIGELVNPAVLVHPQRERIVELMNAGRFELRRMLPSPDTHPDRFTWDEAMSRRSWSRTTGRRSSPSATSRCQCLATTWTARSFGQLRRLAGRGRIRLRSQAFRVSADGAGAATKSDAPDRRGASPEPALARFDVVPPRFVGSLGGRARVCRDSP